MLVGGRLLQPSRAMQVDTHSLMTYTRHPHCISTTRRLDGRGGGMASRYIYKNTCRRSARIELTTYTPCRRAPTIIRQPSLDGFRSVAECYVIFQHSDGPTSLLGVSAKATSQCTNLTDCTDRTSLHTSTFRQSQSHSKRLHDERVQFSACSEPTD